MMADRCEQVDEVVVVEAVVGVSGFAADADEACLAQKSELLRRGALCEPCGVRQLLDRPFTTEHGPQEPQPTGGPEGTHRLGQRFRLGGLEWARGRLVLERVRHRQTVHPHDCSCVPVRAARMRRAAWTVAVGVGGAAVHRHTLDPEPAARVEKTEGLGGVGGYAGRTREGGQT